MKRIQIMGCSGAGKSTLARKLGEITGLPVIHIDRLFWKSGWVESTKEEIDQKILRAASEPRWILDGNYSRTLQLRLDRCDMVIYLDFPRLFCIWSVLRRYLQNKGQIRPDMAEGCPEKIDLEFLHWVWTYNRKHRDKFLEMLGQMPEEKVVILKNRREIAKFLEGFQSDKNLAPEKWL